MSSCQETSKADKLEGKDGEKCEKDHKIQEAANEKGEKRKLPTSDDKPELSKTPEVHSANKWEEANLGDDERKHKFLKLMGAEKSTHAGKIVIGDTTKEGMERTSAKAADGLNTQLEEQYLHSLEHKLQGPRRHGGLGFHDTQDKPPEPQDKDKEEAVEKPQEGGGDEKPAKEESKNPLDKYKKMSFVKSSS